MSATETFVNMKRTTHATSTAGPRKKSPVLAVFEI